MGNLSYHYWMAIESCGKMELKLTKQKAKAMMRWYSGSGRNFVL